jgi:hypothetical protein
LSDHELHVEMRKRAYGLADTGRYDGWPEIMSVLNQEADFEPLRVRAIGNDALFVSMVNARCRQAKDRNG